MDAVTWARAALDERGIEVRGIEEVRHRAWSTVWRITTPDGDLFLKTAPDGVAAEPAILDLLARYDVPHVQRPVAASGNHVLLPDGGPIVRLVDDAETVWPEVMRHYAEVQWATEVIAPDLVRAGVPDVRLPLLPDVAAELLDRWAPERRDLLAVLRDRAEELDELMPMATLEHSDLHLVNAFARGAVPFDWGDACVSHPFLSLLVSAQEGDAGVRAYLDTFLGEEGTADDPDVQHVLALATTLAIVPRALSWQRAIDAGGDAMPAEWRDAPREWLLRIDEHEQASQHERGTSA